MVSLSSPWLCDSMKCRCCGWWELWFSNVPCKQQVPLGQNPLLLCFWSAHGSKYQQTTEGSKIHLVKNHSNNIDLVCTRCSLGLPVCIAVFASTTCKLDKLIKLLKQCVQCFKLKADLICLNHCTKASGTGLSYPLKIEWSENHTDH